MHKNAVICLLVGDKYTEEYVYKLKRMVARNTTVPHDFICFSDRPIKGINTILIEDSDRFDPVWYKLWIPTYKSMTPYNHKVFFDLDVVIHNNIDILFQLQPTRITVIRSAWKPGHISHAAGGTGINSSIMVWRDDVTAWKAFIKSPDSFMIKYNGIDKFIWNEHIPWDSLPPIAYSYREGASIEDSTPFTYRPNMSVCIFNQYPKPDQLTDVDFIKEFWR